MFRKLKNEKGQYDLTTEGGKISALLSEKKNGYECLRGEVPPNQSRAIEKARFTWHLDLNLDLLKNK